MMELLNQQKKPLNGADVLLVGLAYKKNSGDIRESPSIRLIELLTEYGARISAVDDHVDETRWPAGVRKVALDSDTIGASDIVVLVTDHDDLDLSLLDHPTTPVLDAKNKASGANVERL
jgi:UDP-N-acetyl-D-mannosaminuronate dehydrogenase